MSDRPFIESIKIENLLSFPPGSPEIKLERLNVLIGPNGSGKSNLVDIVGLLRDAPNDMLRQVNREGGWGTWFWNGGQEAESASLEVLADPKPLGPIHWGLSISKLGPTAMISSEVLEPFLAGDPVPEAPEFYFRRDQGADHMSLWDFSDSPNGICKKRPMADYDWGKSILSQMQDRIAYPQLYQLGKQLPQIAIFRKFAIDRRKDSRLRQQQPTDIPVSFLSPHGSNLNLALHSLNKPPTRELINKYIGELYPRARGLSFEVMGNAIQLFLEEGKGGRLIPATRLSDGTMQYLCLLAILCHPEPPPLICLEEPEVGLHPDIISALGRLLVEASERTQLIVTTHSESLVAAMSEYAQYVVVCENRGRGTEMRRLDPEQLTEWLEKYTLGDLWAMGEIGGNRW